MFTMFTIQEFASHGQTHLFIETACEFKTLFIFVSLPQFTISQKCKSICVAAAILFSRVATRSQSCYETEQINLLTHFENCDVFTQLPAEHYDATSHWQSLRDVSRKWKIGDKHTIHPDLNSFIVNRPSYSMPSKIVDFWVIILANKIAQKFWWNKLKLFCIGIAFLCIIQQKLTSKPANRKSPANQLTNSHQQTSQRTLTSKPASGNSPANQLTNTNQ